MDISLGGHTYPNTTAVKSVYGDGSLALVLEDRESTVAVVSVRLEDAPAEGCIWVKDYSENAGVLDALVSAGVLAVTGRTSQAGFATVQEARVLA